MADRPLSLSELNFIPSVRADVFMICNAISDEIYGLWGYPCGIKEFVGGHLPFPDDQSVFWSVSGDMLPFGSVWDLIDYLYDPSLF